jgi:hypothetical protein
MWNTPLRMSENGQHWNYTRQWWHRRCYVVERLKYDKTADMKLLSWDARCTLHDQNTNGEIEEALNIYNLNKIIVDCKCKWTNFSSTLMTATRSATLLYKYTATDRRSKAGPRWMGDTEHVTVEGCRLQNFIGEHEATRTSETYRARPCTNRPAFKCFCIHFSGRNSQTWHVSATCKNACALGCLTSSALHVAHSTSPVCLSVGSQQRVRWTRCGIARSFGCTHGVNRGQGQKLTARGLAAKTRCAYDSPPPPIWN